MKLRSMVARHLNSRQTIGAWVIRENKESQRSVEKKKKRKRKRGKGVGFVEVDNSSRRMVAAEKLFRHEQEHRDIPVEESHNL